MELLFKIANASVIPAWIFLVFFRKSHITQTWIFSYRYHLVLSVFYLLFIFGGMAENTGGGMNSMAALRQSFTNDKILLAAWVHYLVFDLFVGVWMTKKGIEKNISPFIISPFLMLTLFFGPVGFFSFSIYFRFKNNIRYF